MTDTGGAVALTRYSDYVEAQAWSSAAVKRIEVGLRRLLVGIRSDDPIREPLVHTLASSGKRVRSLVALACSCLAEGNREPSNEAIEAAAAIEALHEATLVHDDIIDRSLFRRGQLSVAERFGTKTAAGTGAAIAGAGISALGRLHSCRGITLDLDCLQALAEAQIMECLRPPEDLPSLHRFIVSITDGKTSVLFILAARVGVSFGSRLARVNELTRLENFARALGRAFQIRDDVLDIRGETPGQSPKCDDLVHGKLSWPAYLWLRTMPDLRTALTSLLKCQSSPELSAALRLSILQSGAIARASSLANHNLKRAASRITDLPESAGRQALLHLLERLWIPIKALEPEERSSLASTHCDYYWA